jgi:diguanylate cyclase (GGDEF)-like protein
MQDRSSAADPAGGRLSGLAKLAERLNLHRPDRTLYRSLVDSLFSSPSSIISGSIGSSLTPYVCYTATGLDAFFYLCLLTLAIVALRLVTVVSYRRLDSSKLTIEEVRRWDREYFIGATVMSLALGLTCYLALARTTSSAAHILSVAAVIAMMSGYVARNAGRPVFVIIQTLFFCVPLIIGLLQSGDIYYRVLGWCTMIVVLGNIAITLSIYRNLIALSRATLQSDLLANALRKQNITLDAAMNNMGHGLIMLDEDLRLAVANRRFRELFDLPEALGKAGTSLSAIAQHLLRSGLVGAQELAALRRACEAILADASYEQCEIAVGGGRSYVVSVAGVPAGGAVMLVEDATERKLTEAKIERLARYDDLTGLANRFSFGLSLDESCKRLHRTGESFALIYVDLDNFKQINDTLGHEIGDQVLAETARRLRAASQYGDLVARFGGDEFVLLNPHLGRDGVEALGKRLIDSLGEPFDVAGKAIHVTASVGIAIAPEHGDSSTDLLRHADLALYAAKAAGRRNFVVFNPAMAAEMNERNQLETDLRAAVGSGQLSLHFQPVVDLTSGDILTFEALMRWRHPTRGFVPPSTFIPIAEEIGLVDDMGEWALKEACRAAASLPLDVSVAVNVSPLQFRRPKRLIAAVRAAIDEAQLAPRRLYLEVTESLLIEDRESTLGAIRELRRMGVRFSLDDFGTGYSSLAYLSTYPFSQVKIDRSFARDVASNSTSRSIVQAVCQLARRLGMQVVVEGIESEEQLEAVRMLGAERAQGYFFGKPQPLEIAANLVRSAA